MGKLHYKLVVPGAAAVLALSVLGNVSSDASTAPNRPAAPTGHRVAPSGQVHFGSAHKTVLRKLPSGGRVQSHVPPTRLRNGNPTGSNLPSRPTSGTKPGAASSASAPQPLILQNSFDGLRQSNASCNCQPPDVNAAIGPSHIVESVNLSLAVYSKAGALLQNTALATFLGTSDGLSDPRVVYDPTWNRWTLVLTDTSSPSLWFAYSAGPDPTGGWWIYHVGFPFAAGSIVDYPMVGMDQDALIYTSNNFDASDNYINSTAFTVAKARVYNGFGWGAPLFGVNYNTTPAIVGGRPTQQSSPTFMLSPDDANNVMKVYSFSNTSKGATLVFKGDIPYSWAAPPRRVNQPGTAQTLDPLDGRIGWAVSQLDGRVWFAHGAAIGSFPGVNWGYVLTGNMTMAVSTAFVNGTSDDFNPSIAAMKDGAGVTREVLSWAYTDTPNGVPTTDVYAIHSGVSVVHVGSNGATGPVGSSTGQFRFGDYSSVAPEYNAVGTCTEGQAALVANQYFATDGTWKTRLARVSIPCP